MKGIYLILFAAILIGCKSNNRKNNPVVEVNKPVVTDTSKPAKKTDSLPSATSGQDSSTYVDVTVPDWSSKEIDLNLEQISASVFNRYVKNYKTSCPLDSSGFPAGRGLILKNSCNEICENYLVDEKAHTQIMLPSDYDAGIMGLVVSPSCQRFIVYSSYDGPGYDQYYNDRVEIFGFSIGKQQGLKAIKPLFMHTSKDWSVEELTWVDDHTIALKIYTGDRVGDGSGVDYKYVKARLNGL